MPKSEETPQPLAPGMKFPAKGKSHLRIMAAAEGHFMCRYTGAIPFCLSEKELRKLINTLALENPTGNT